MINFDDKYRNFPLCILASKEVAMTSLNRYDWWQRWFCNAAFFMEFIE
jgi:hypothetical protein